MTTILELKTGLFPDAERVAEAVETLGGTLTVARADTTGLAPDDTDGWAAVARAILSADLIVTL
ncbi:hypothetical protein [Maritimibacter fusiformis]|uniref:Uncharacterized protein n=1 Tax=Maritimibacter fusiformis TaxID=2603819 RepID=A0A5D0RLZ8_9RHOB|nr:hypothetical protein [Maritimibacter fusiformis]TYB82139.1 hypothetical protein FVF75_05250 [Maritimibacter fusiformis]